MNDAYQTIETSPSDGCTSGTSPTHVALARRASSFALYLNAESSPRHKAPIQRDGISKNDGFKQSHTWRKDAFCVSGNSPTQLISPALAAQAATPVPKRIARRVSGESRSDTPESPDESAWRTVCNRDHQHERIGAETRKEDRCQQKQN